MIPVFAEKTPEQMDFLNTICVTGTELLERKQKARTQQDIIFEWFRLNGPIREFTPPEVHDAIPGLADAPLTSIRRAMTNLTRAKKLVKTDKKVPGPYGAPNYKWRLNPFAKGDN